MNPHYAQTALRAGHRCEYCHAPEVVFNFPFEVEHIIPASRGGGDAVGNRALACRSCNLRKAAHISGIDPESQAEIRLFHPRDDQWEEHFRVDAESGKIEGLTPIGRAAVARLEMNSESQGVARRQWMRLGLFP
jgi:HNH endonuclease